MVSVLLAALMVGSNDQVVKLTWHDFTKEEWLVASNRLPVFEVAGLQPTAGYLDKDPPEGVFQAGPGYVPDGYRKPPNVFKPQYFPLSQYGGQSTCVVARSKPDGPIGRLWIDWNRNKRWDDLEQAALSTARNPGWGPDLVLFEYKRAPSKRPNPVRLKVFVARAEIAYVMPSGWLQGAVKLGGKKLKIAVIDVNANGVFNEGGNAPDALVVDEKGSGRLDPANRTPLAGLVQLPDGNYWVPTVAKDGSEIRLKRDTTPVGSIKFVGGAPTAASLKGAKGLLACKAVRGGITAPAGSYTTSSVSLSVAGTDGKPWLYTVSGLKATIPPGGVATVTIGGPITLSLNANKLEGGYEFALDVKDRSGAKVVGLDDSNGSQPNPPTLTISGPDGKVAHSMLFTYG